MEVLFTKKGYQYFLGLFTIIIIILVITYIFELSYGKKFSSPNNHYKVFIKNNGAFLFGSHDIVIYAKDRWTVFKYNTDIANDGKTLNASNYNVEWSEDIAYITLSGEDQDDEDLMVDFKNKTIKHRKMNYKVISTNEEVSKEYFDDEYGKSELISHNIKILDENNNNVLPYNIAALIRTLKYEQEDGIAKIKWYSEGCATVYKNSNMTLIDCPYNYNSKNEKDYENLPYNSHRYIVAPADYQYEYDLCISK